MPLCSDCKHEARERMKSNSDTCDRCGSSMEQQSSERSSTNTGPKLTPFQRILSWFGLQWKTVWSGYIFQRESSPNMGKTVITVHEGKVGENKYTGDRELRVGGVLDRRKIHQYSDALPNTVTVDKQEQFCGRTVSSEDIVIYDGQYVHETFVDGDQDE